MAITSIVLIPSPKTNFSAKLCSKELGPIDSTLLGRTIAFTFHENKKAALLIVFSPSEKVIEEKKFDTFTHNKAIQKALESYRVKEENKEYLKTLKIK